MDDTKYWVAFNLVPGIGRAKFALLQERFGDLGEAWRASASELHAAGLDARSVEAIIARRGEVYPEAEMERLERQGVQAITWKDSAYPPRLKEIYDLPPVLYVKGTLTPQDQTAIAVVGTREASAYGKEVAGQLSSDLARHGVTVVSGLARGIDAVAHRAALAAGGQTIAVVASGPDIVYPPEHTQLAREVAARGAVVCDYPLGTRPRADNFPRRNRIMSGLSLGVLVVEAGEGSGALITARWALEQNREVFAVPGSIFSPRSLGCHRLIQDGAKLVHGFQDILEELNLGLAAPRPAERPRDLPKAPVSEEPPAAPPIEANEALLLRHLSLQPTHIDEVCRASGLPLPTVSSALVMMELKGLVKQVGAMNYIRAREAAASYQAT
ncbi:MAG: DNA-protecting protein DprA [Chloroflexi bacterium]|nr:DNA-protecting protein DprA [Chloroflexota bacterium]